MAHIHTATRIPTQKSRCSESFNKRNQREKSQISSLKFNARKKLIIDVRFAARIKISTALSKAISLCHTDKRTDSQPLTLAERRRARKRERERRSVAALLAAVRSRRLARGLPSSREGERDNVEVATTKGGLCAFAVEELQFANTERRDAKE